MKLTMDHGQRLSLHAIMGMQRADVGSIRAIWKIMDQLKLDIDEEIAIEVKKEAGPNGSERLIWNPEKSIPAKEFDFSDADLSRIKAAIDSWQGGFGAGGDRRWLEPLVVALYPE